MQYEDILPATKSSKRNGIAFTPSETSRGGHLVIHTGKARHEYYVVEIEATGGRAVRMVKVEGCPGSDPDVASYEVFLPVASRYHPYCSCKGFSRHAGCKHTSALAVILENSWMPGDEPVEPAIIANGITEAEMPECFHGVGSSSESCPF